MRVSLLILSNVLVVASVGISINRAGTFYASWGDLFGLQSNLKQIAIAPENLALITKKDLQSAKKTKAGSLIFKKVITGQDSGISGRVIVVMTPKLVNEIKSINRQGERFSTTFTEAGKSLLKTLTKDDFEDMTTISGDKYFELMRYEY